MTPIQSATAVEPTTVMICVLQVENMRFAIEADHICEVLGEIPSKSVPLAPEYIHGVLSYRGDVLTALSLRTLLGLRKVPNKNCVLVLGDKESEEKFGLAVDSVAGLITIPRDTLEPNPGSLDTRSMFLFDGLYRMPSSLMVRINPQQLRPSRIADTGLFDSTTTQTAGWLQ